MQYTFICVFDNYFLIVVIHMVSKKQIFAFKYDWEDK